jgi:hypothetical protein
MLLLEPARGSSITLPLADGDQGTAQTIALIRQLVDHGMKDPVVNRTALAILQSVPPHDEEAEVRALYDWVRGHIRFTKDLYGKETLRPAAVILEVGAGDCDDINGILLPALLGTVGYRTRLVTIASHPEAPDEFSHVYAEACVRGQWIPLDAARPGAAFGRAPMHFLRKRIWELNRSVYQDVQGLGQDEGLGGFNWWMFAQIVPKITQATTSIVSAIRTPSYMLPLMQSQSAQAAAMQAVTPSTPLTATPGYTNVPGVGLMKTESLIFYGLLAVGVIFLLKK